jgi:CheY-like chemotaxis protein
MNETAGSEIIMNADQTQKARSKRGLLRAFWRLLRAPEDASGESVEAWKPQPKQRSGKQILIVDDDPVILKTTSHKLSAAGYAVSTAVDGSEAINVVGCAKPDLIILDLDFPPDVANGGKPGWDGFRLMTWLRGLRNTQGTRFIIITGSCDPAEAERRALASGAAGFFSKPINFPALTKLIDVELFPKPSQAAAPLSVSDTPEAATKQAAASSC